MKWFKHQTDSNRNPKIEKLLLKYGADGYALYWLCIEYIAGAIDNTEISFELKHDAEILAHRLHIDTRRVEDIMMYMVSINLFEYNEINNRVVCVKLAERLDNSIVKNPQLKELQAQIKISGIIPDNPGKVRLDKTRLDESKDNTLLDKEFDEFWDICPKKVDKKNTKKVFVKLNSEDRMKAKKDIATRYSETEKQYIPAPSVYLRGERWDDEQLNDNQIDDVYCEGYD